MNKHWRSYIQNLKGEAKEIFEKWKNSPGPAPEYAMVIISSFFEQEGVKVTPETLIFLSNLTSINFTKAYMADSTLTPEEYNMGKLKWPQVIEIHRQAIQFQLGDDYQNANIVNQKVSDLFELRQKEPQQQHLVISFAATHEKLPLHIEEILLGDVKLCAASMQSNKNEVQELLDKIRNSSSSSTYIAQALFYGPPEEIQKRRENIKIATKIFGEMFPYQNKNQPAQTNRYNYKINKLLYMLAGKCFYENLTPKQLAAMTLILKNNSIKRNVEFLNNLSSLNSEKVPEFIDQMVNEIQSTKINPVQINPAQIDVLSPKMALSLTALNKPNLYEELTPEQLTNLTFIFANAPLKYNIKLISDLSLLPPEKVSQFIDQSVKKLPSLKSESEKDLYNLMGLKSILENNSPKQNVKFINHLSLLPPKKALQFVNQTYETVKLSSENENKQQQTAKLFHIPKKLLNFFLKKSETAKSLPQAKAQLFYRAKKFIRIIPQKFFNLCSNKTANYCHIIPKEKQRPLKKIRNSSKSKTNRQKKLTKKTK